MAWCLAPDMDWTQSSACKSLLVAQVEEGMTQIPEASLQHSLTTWLQPRLSLVPRKAVTRRPLSPLI